MDTKNISSFLKFGYFMDFQENEYPLDFSKIDKNTYSRCKEEELIDLGISKFMDAVSSDFYLNQNHVVPLSGGLDSRALLAALLEFTDARNISTYTFGTPGTLDYDIGEFVAKKIGTKHSNFPLTSYRYTQKELENISDRICNQTMLFHHPPIGEIDELYNNHIVWSGFIGDAIVGGHLPNQPSKDFSEAKDKYLKKAKYVKTTSLTNVSDDELSDYINFDIIDRDILSFEEQILFNERIRKLTAPHVLMKGFNYKTPFINNDFMNFMLSIDNKYRQNEYLFIEIMQKAFPKLFSLKTKTNYGLPLKVSKGRVQFKRVENKIRGIIGGKFAGVVDPYINYLDFNKSIRDREDLKNIFRSNISDLKSRNIIQEVEIEALLSMHLDNKANFADALIILTSLEIHLKALEKNKND